MYVYQVRKTDLHFFLFFMSYRTYRYVLYVWHNYDTHSTGRELMYSTTLLYSIMIVYRHVYWIKRLI
jgi:hypothetical protein